MNFKRLIASVLTTSLMITNVFGATVVYVQDMPIGWSKEAVQSALDSGVLTAEDGYVRPTDLLIRAELALGINNVFSTSDKADLSEYTDVSPTKWYYDEMSKAVALGLFSGYGNGLLKPENNITREELLAALYNILELQVGNVESLDKFVDKDKISTWAKEIVAKMSEKEFIAGNIRGEVKPLEPITREEFAQVMKNIFSDYFLKPGTYTRELEGNVVINSPGVNLTDCKINGDLIIAEGVKLGEIILDNVNINGRILTRAGSSIKVINESKIGEVLINNKKNEVNLQIENSDVEKVALKTSGIVEGDVKSITINEEVSLQTTGNVNEILVNKKADIKVLDNKIEKIIINPSATSTQVSGKGKVDTVIANANEVVVQTGETKVIAGISTIGVKAGSKEVKAGETAIVSTKSAGGGGGGGGGGGTKVCAHDWKLEIQETCETAAKEVCSKCSEERLKDKTFEHNWETVEPAKCDTPEKLYCDNCKTYKQGQDALGHDYGGVKVCIRCGKLLEGVCAHVWQVDSKETCTTFEVLKCTQCGESMKGKDELGHDYKTASAATCEIPEIKKCTRCEATEYGQDALKHDLKIVRYAACEVTKLEVCQRCNTEFEGEALPHILVTTDETCEEDGSIVCTRKYDYIEEDGSITIDKACDYFVLLPKLGHSMITVDPTCLDDGYSYCNRNCGYILPGESKLGHDLDIVPATCEEDGSETCKRECGYTAILPLLGHNMKVVGTDCSATNYKVCANNCGREEHETMHNIKSVAATCTVAGLEVCQNQSCAYYKVLDAIEHNFDEGWFAATCDEAKYRVCLNCNTKEVKGEALGHNFDENGKCTRCPKTVAVVCNHDYQETTPATCLTAAIETCNNCGATRDGTAALKHEWIPKTEATCKAPATYECSKCFAIIDVGETVDHDWKVIEPACLTTGYIYCEVCSDIKDIIAANGHTLDENNKCKVCDEVVCEHESWQVVSEATCTIAEKQVCSICNTEKDGKAATGHSYQLTSGATCKSAAIEECSKCDVIRKVGKPLEHDWVITSSAKCDAAEIQTCSNCGETQTIGEKGKHTFVITAPTCDEDGYLTCSICGIRETGEESVGHELGEEVAATCEKGAYKPCNNCDYEEIVSEPLPHTWEEDELITDCTVDGYKKCEICNATTKELTHNYVIDETVSDCTILGYYKCANKNCVAKSNEETHEFVVDLSVTDCTAEGYKKCSNENCNQTTMETDHIFVVSESTTDCTAEGYEECSNENCNITSKRAEHIILINNEITDCTAEGYYICSNPKCLYKDSTRHILDITKEASCSELGLKECSNRGCEYTEEISMLPHTMLEENRKAPDCESEGYIKCKYCDYKEDIIPAIGHNMVTTIYPTCTTAGRKECNNGCGKYLEIEPLEHILVAVGEDCTASDFIQCTREGCTTYEYIPPENGHNLKTIEATCTEKGYIFCLTKDCKEIQEIDLGGHSWPEEFAEPTCTEDVYITCTRENCGAVKLAASKLGHNFVDKICTRCNEKISQESCNHEFGETTEATCIMPSTHTCSKCDLVEELEGALGHNPGKVIEPTCMTIGYTLCSRTGCEEMLDIVLALGHDFENGEVIEPTCTTMGYTKCANCDEISNMLPIVDHDWDENNICSWCEVAMSDICSHSEYEILHTVDCINPEQRKCNICNTEYSYGIALGHDFKAETNATCTVVGTEKCSREGCGVIQETTLAEHTWEITTQATCSTFARQTCSTCGAERVDPETELPSHIWAPEYNVAPTCTSYGKQVCGVCGILEIDLTQEILPHTFLEEDGQEPTCEIGGYQICAICETKVELDKLGHNFEGNSATCTKGATKKCSRCGQEKYEAKLGHDAELIAEANCVMPAQYRCKRCGEEYEEGEERGHNYSELQSPATCISPAIWKCTNVSNQIACDATTQLDDVKIDHNSDTHIPATCQNVEQYKCSMCNKTMSEGERLGDHIWPIRCLTDGEETCLVDGCGETMFIEAVGAHQFEDGVCTVCNEPETYIVTLNVETNGGTLEVENTIEKLNNGKSFADDNIEFPEPTKENATFNGWYTAASEGELVDENTILSGENAEIALYAQFIDIIQEEPEADPEEQTGGEPTV